MPHAGYAVENIEDIATVLEPHGFDGRFTSGERQLLC